MSLLYNKIVNFFSQFNILLGNKKLITAINTQSNISSKLNIQKVIESLHHEYTIKMLEKVQKELEQAFLIERELEKKTTLHTNVHNNILERMHNIKENINKVKNELFILESKSLELETQIKKDLKFLPYNSKK